MTSILPARGAFANRLNGEAMWKRGNNVEVRLAVRAPPPRDYCVLCGNLPPLCVFAPLRETSNRRAVNDLRLFAAGFVPAHFGA